MQHVRVCVRQTEGLNWHSKHGNLFTTARGHCASQNAEALHSDESGRLYLSELVATIARLRFTCWRSVCVTRIDLHA
jgi:hypothetical protein